VFTSETLAPAGALGLGGGTTLGMAYRKYANHAGRGHNLSNGRSSFIRSGSYTIKLD